MSKKDNLKRMILLGTCLFIGCLIIALRFFILKPFFDDFLSGKFLTDTAFIIATILFLFLIWYYVDTYWSKGVSIFHQAGKDVSHILVWLFSVNGLFVLLISAVIALVVFIIRCGNIPGNDMQLQLISVTLTITLSALIPTMISRIVTKNQLNEIIEQKLETELEKYKTSLYSIRKDKGHASRMSAVLLEQMSDLNGDEAKIQTCQNNAAWSIGWASDAIIQYVLIRDVYSNAIKNSAACLNIIYKSAHHIQKDNGLIKSEIKPRDLKSLITMHSLILKSGLVDILQEDANRQRQDSNCADGNNNPLLEFGEWSELIKSIETIEKAFYNKYLKQNNSKPIDFSNFCTITGMTAEFNDELNSYAVGIIKDILKEDRALYQNYNYISSSE